MIYDKLCLSGEMAKDYFRTAIGETLKLTVHAVLKTAGMHAPDSAEDEETPYVEFEVLDCDGGRKPYSEMSPGEIDQEIYNVKNEDQAMPSTIPNREDGGSIWTDIKRQDKINRKPTKRPPPLGFK